jgi:regulator of protease activity HflC (stomatin/prohibitin superfamily)
MSTATAADTYTADDDLLDDEDLPETWLGRLWRFIRNQSNRVLLLAGVVLFALAYFWPAVFVTIDSGQVGVMYLRFGGGTVTDRLLGEGLRFVPPWDKLFIYNVRLQEIRHTMTALTEEGLEIKFDLSIRYRPELELVGLLHQKVGPDYPDKVVVPEVESALRSIVGGQKLDVVYTASQEVVQRVVTEVLEQASRNYVHVDEVVVRHIELPKLVREKIEAKLIEKETSESYEFRLKIATSEAERQKIEAGGIAVYNGLVGASLTPSVMQWEALQATKELAKSPNAKTIIIGRNADGLPIILPPQ